jgi:hypothetical protein
MYDVGQLDFAALPGVAEQIHTASGLDQLGNFPILQIFGGIAVLIITVAAFVYGLKRGNKDNEQYNPMEARIRKELDLYRERTNDRLERLTEDVRVQLSENRRVMYERLESTDDSLRALQIDFAHMQGRFGRDYGLSKPKPRDPSR